MDKPSGRLLGPLGLGITQVSDRPLVSGRLFFRQGLALLSLPRLPLLR